MREMKHSVERLEDKVEEISYNVQKNLKSLNIKEEELEY